MNIRIFNLNLNRVVSLNFTKSKVIIIDEYTDEIQQKTQFPTHTKQRLTEGVMCILCYFIAEHKILLF